MQTPEQKHAEYLKHKDSYIARAKLWREKNTERLREYEAKRYRENQERRVKTTASTIARRKSKPELHLEENRRYREKNREKIRTSARKYNDEHLAEHRSYYLEHKEEIKAKHLKYYQDHPEIWRETWHRRRARKHAAPVVKFKNADISEACKWICQICRGKVNKKLKHPDPMSPSLDHIIPLAKGGMHEPSNCQLAHLICNIKKNSSPAPYGSQIGLPLTA